MTGDADTNPDAAELLAAQGEGTWAKYRSEWWKLYFTGDLAHFWPSQLDQTELDDNGYRWISRDDVFAIAADDSALHTAVASTVWGVGKWAFRVGRFVKPFTKNRETVEGNLQRSAAALAADGPVAAYEAMIRGGSASTRFMGPAYFTKFLYFSGYRSAADLKPLILDRRVARGLRARDAFGPNSGDTNWPSHMYRTYLEYCHEQNPDDPAAVEMALFNEGKG
jgi:hypothetical protein